MNPLDLIPKAHNLPLEPIWFSFLLTATFVVHLLLMNAMLGSGIIALVSSFSKTEDSRLRERSTSRRIPFLIAFAINTGVAPLLFIQVLYGQFIYTSSVLMAVYWISVIPALLAAYYAAYVYSIHFTNTAGLLRSLLIGMSVATLLFVAFMFSNNMTLMLTPDRWSQYFDNRGGTLLNLSEPTLAPRLLHFITASAAVGGLFYSLCARFQSKPGSLPAISWGLQWFTWATLVQVAVGIWFLFSLPAAVRSMLVGGNTAMTTVFGLAVCCALASLAASTHNRLATTVVMAVLTIIFMALVRGYVRQAYLEAYFSPELPAVSAEYGPLIMFLASLTAVVAAGWYMLKRAFSGKEVPEP